MWGGSGLALGWSRLAYIDACYVRAGDNKWEAGRWGPSCVACRRVCKRAVVFIAEEVCTWNTYKMVHCEILHRVAVECSALQRRRDALCTMRNMPRGVQRLPYNMKRIVA